MQQQRNHGCLFGIIAFSRLTYPPGQALEKETTSEKELQKTAFFINFVGSPNLASSDLHFLSVLKRPSVKSMIEQRSAPYARMMWGGIFFSPFF